MSGKIEHYNSPDNMSLAAVLCKSTMAMIRPKKLSDEVSSCYENAGWIDLSKWAGTVILSPYHPPFFEFC